MNAKRIPLKEIGVIYSRASGAGGQNVNKRDTKAQIRWHLRSSSAFNDSEKLLLEHALDPWMTLEGDVIISNQESRSREQNQQRAIDRLNELVRIALIPKKKRVPTKPTRSSKEKRIQDKKVVSRKKTFRKPIGDSERD